MMASNARKEKATRQAERIQAERVQAERMQKERVQATEALVTRMDRAFATIANRQGRLPHDMYEERRLALAYAWRVTLIDPVARGLIQLDARWNVSKSTGEGMLTLLEVLLDLCVWGRGDSAWNVLFDDACRADLLGNLYGHSFRVRKDKTRKHRCIAWHMDPSDGSNNHENLHRHDLVYVCQSVIAHLMRYDTWYGRMLGEPVMLHFVIQILGYVLERVPGCSVTHLDARHFFFMLAHSFNETLFTQAAALVHRCELTSDQCGESLVHIMVRYAFTINLQAWISNTQWLDQALHSDWNQPSHFLERDLTDRGLHARLDCLQTCQERWTLHIQPAMIHALHVHLPIDLVRYVVCPYLDEAQLHTHSQSM
jgi:hypothetical protein